VKKEITRLIHGDCPSSVRNAITSALTAAACHRDAGRNGFIAQIGHLASSLPGIREQHANPEMLANLLSQTAVADPPLCMSAVLHYTLCGGSLVNLGEDQQVKTHLSALDSGAAKGVYLITEIGTSGSLTGAHTQAVYEPGQHEFTLTTPDPQGLKFSSVAPDGGPCIAVVFARLIHGGNDKGVYPFIVPLTGIDGPLPGVEISAPFTVSSLPLRYGVIRLQQVRIPYGNWLSGEARIDNSGFDDPTPREVRLTRSLAAGGASLYATLPAAMAAISRVSATRALKHAEHRVTQARLTPGAPLLSHQTQQISLFGAFAESLVLTAVARQAQHALQQGGTEDRAMGFGPWTSVHPDLPIYKAISTEGAVRVVRECRERCGLHGVLDINELSPYQGLAEAFVTAGGDNRLILIDTGIALTESLDPLPDVVPPDSDVASVEWWPRVCHAHRTWLTADLREKLKKTNGQWSGLTEEARILGQAHAHHLAAQAQRTVVSSVTNPKLRKVLENLSVLYGVIQARRLAGPLISSGALQPTAVRSLGDVANELCKKIAPRLPVLYEIGGLSHHEEPPLGSANYATTLTSVIPFWDKGGPV
jgi:acyl-CoA oxidase